MIRSRSIAVAVLLAGLAAPAARAHELWFQPTDAKAASRLTFGDSPAPGEAERVAEIAHAKLWGDGKLLEVDRRPDGLEARWAGHRPEVLSAYADRGVVDYQGDSFVIHLAAYAQAGPIPASRVGKDGLADDQVRLHLVANGAERPVVRASWKGKPAADAAVTIFRGTAEPVTSRTDNKGEIPCPDLSAGPVQILVAVMDKTPGRRDGKSFSHLRYKATLLIDPNAAVAECLDRVKEIHGGTGPWAVVGYRMGQRSLRELGVDRGAFHLLVVHSSPAEVQYSCMADGLQAATGTSPGKLNLRLETAPVERLHTTVEDRKTGRRLVFTLNPGLARSIVDLPGERLETEGRRVAGLPDDAIFTVTEGEAAKK